MTTLMLGVLAFFVGTLFGGFVGYWIGYKTCEQLFRRAARDVGRHYEFRKRT